MPEQTAWMVVGPSNVIQWWTNHDDRDESIRWFVGRGNRINGENLTWEHLEAQGYACREFRMVPVVEGRPFAAGRVMHRCGLCDELAEVGSRCETCGYLPQSKG